MSDVPADFDENSTFGTLNLWGSPDKPEQVAEDRIEIVNSKGQKLGEVIDFALSGPVWEWGVGPATASFSTSPLNPTIQNLPINTRGVEVFITTGDGEQWWGYPDAISDGSPTSITFSCKGIRNLIGKRFIDRSSLLFTDIATGEIMRQLIFYAQNETHQSYRYENLWPRIVDYNITPERWSSHKRSRDYSREQHANILDLLDEFRSLDTPIVSDVGWDEMPVAPGNTAGVRRYINITPWYFEPWLFAFPLVYAAETDGSNISSFGGYQENSDDVVNDVYVTGGSNGDVQFEAHVTDQAAAKLRGLQTDVISAGDVKDVPWLQARGRKEITDRKNPDVSFTLTVVTVPASVGKLMMPGTIWPVHIYCGRIQAHGMFRILSKEWNSNRTYTVRLQAVTGVVPDYEPAFEWPGDD